MAPVHYRENAFGVVFGSGRGLDEAATIQRLREEHASAIPQSFSETGADGHEVTRYYRFNSPTLGILHREDGPAYVEKHPSGDLITKYLIEGRLHAVDGPAVIKLLDGGRTRIDEWYAHNLLHREDGPAFVETHGGMCTERWYYRNHLYRADGPAIKISKPDGSQIREWYLDDLLHCEDGPARVVVEADGSRTEEWLYHNRLHRLGGPAHISYTASGVISEVMYFINNQLHRKDGPACMRTGLDGELSVCDYYLRGRKTLGTQQLKDLFGSKLYPSHSGDVDEKRSRTASAPSSSCDGRSAAVAAAGPD